MLVGLLILQSFQGVAQKNKLPFEPGEKILYGAYFNWYFLWINAGDVLFQCDTSPYRNQKAWHLKAQGKTHKSYDRFYTVRDTFESFLSYPKFEPLWFRRVINHGEDHSRHEYDFYPDKKIIDFRINRGKEQPVTGRVPWSNDVHDLLSCAYSFRGLDFERMKEGQKVTFEALIDDTAETLFFRYLGMETIETRNDRAFRCHKVSVWLVEGDFFPEGEYMKVWFTADQNRLPVMVETKILVGSVKAVLLNEQRLKYPLTSEIKVK